MTDLYNFLHLPYSTQVLCLTKSANHTFKQHSLIC